MRTRRSRTCARRSFPAPMVGPFGSWARGSSCIWRRRRGRDEFWGGREWCPPRTICRSFGRSRARSFYLPLCRISCRSPSWCGQHGRAHGQDGGRLRETAQGSDWFASAARPSTSTWWPRPKWRGKKCWGNCKGSSNWSRRYGSYANATSFGLRSRPCHGSRVWQTAAATWLGPKVCLANTSSGSHHAADSRDFRLFRRRGRGGRGRRFWLGRSPAESSGSLVQDCQGHAKREEEPKKQGLGSLTGWSRRKWFSARCWWVVPRQSSSLTHSPADADKQPRAHLRGDREATSSRLGAQWFRPWPRRESGQCAGLGRAPLEDPELCFQRETSLAYGRDLGLPTAWENSRGPSSGRIGSSSDGPTGLRQRRLALGQRGHSGKPAAVQCFQSAHPARAVGTAALSAFGSQVGGALLGQAQKKAKLGGKGKRAEEPSGRDTKNDTAAKGRGKTGKKGKKEGTENPPSAAPADTWTLWLLLLTGAVVRKRSQLSSRKKVPLECPGLVLRLQTSWRFGIQWADGFWKAILRLPSFCSLCRTSGLLLKEAQLLPCGRCLCLFQSVGVEKGPTWLICLFKTSFA